MLDTLLDNLGWLLAKRCLPRAVIIVGSGRSGTSVLLQALGRHPAVLAAPGESPFLTSIGGGAALFEYGEKASYYQQSLTPKRDYFLAQLAKLGFEAALGEHYGLKSFLAAARAGDRNVFNKRAWCAKSFPPPGPTKGLALTYPNVRYLYIIRNGIEVIHSMSRFHGFRDQTFREHCEAWAATVSRYQFLLDLPNAKLVRHEQLQVDPDNLFRDLFDFLELKYDPRPLEFVTTSIIHPLDEPTKSNVQVADVFKKRESPFSSWPPENQGIFKDICGPAMAMAGYKVAG